jgi:prepilin-type N-terminal cleavage/methylation domain-containing protein
MSDRPLNQNGFTLVELMVAIGIASSIVVAAAVVIFQLITVPERNSNHMTAYTQVQNAGFSVSRDAVQAQDITVDGAAWLTLDWVDWEGYAHQAVYTLEDGSSGLKELWRTYSINDVPEETIMVARYIDPGTNSNWDESEHVLTLVITAQVGDESATRTYNIEPRPNS